MLVSRWATVLLFWERTTPGFVDRVQFTFPESCVAFAGTHTSKFLSTEITVSHASLYLNLGSSHRLDLIKLDGSDEHVDAAQHLRIFGILFKEFKIWNIVGSG
jgi:hypothetical protein